MRTSVAEVNITQFLWYETNTFIYKYSDIETIEENIKWVYKTKH